MPHNTKAILVDVNGRPIPQYFDPLLDDFQPLFGSGGAARSVLYGPDGQPINSSNPLPTKDDALAALLGELNNAPVTDPSATSATVLELLRGLLAVAGRETTLAAVKAAIDELTARAATEETLSATRDALDSLAQRGLATEVTLAQAAQALATLAGTVDAGAQQVTLSGSKVARVATQLPGNTTSGSPAREVNFINSIAAATTVIIRDTTSPVTIESLYLLHGDLPNFSDLRVHFYLRDSGGNLRFVPVFGHDRIGSHGGFQTQYFSPETLKNAGGKSNLWELVAWNVDNYRQAIWRMLTPITALHGYRLVAENVNETNSISVRFQVDIREVLLS